MDQRAPPSGPDEIRRFRRRLLEYFHARKRDLPWREATDPYRVLVSEFMLQQTRVETVVPYYRRWMERFPDVDSLSQASLEEVLELWTGLGYYARARNLHRAASIIRERHQGSVPSDPEVLRDLPGVGPYTAGAVASIAHGVPAPAVDGNVRRVLSRINDQATPSPKELREWAGELVDPQEPGAFNQALMELGSTLCKPRAPECAECPVRDHCRARMNGSQEERPAPQRAAWVREMWVGVAVMVAEPGKNGSPRVLLRRRPQEGLLGGMWEFPGEEWQREGGGGDGASPPKPDRAALHAAAAKAAAEEGWAGLEPGQHLGTVEHRFSHRQARYHVFLFRVPAHGEGALDEGDGGRMWHPVILLDEVALSAGQARIRDLVREELPSAGL